MTHNGLTLTIFFSAATLVLLPLRHAEAQLASTKATELVAHRAVYELTLDQTAAGSNVTDIRGELVYDFSGSSCQGYTLNTRLVTEIFDREGKPSKTDIRSESKEEGDGKRYRFTTTQYVNGKLSESTKGLAYRNGRRDGIVVELENG